MPTGTNTGLANARNNVTTCGFFLWLFQIRMPIVEMTNLFQRAIGEVTDVVEKKCTHSMIRNGDSLTLRPKGLLVVFAPVLNMVWSTIRNAGCGMWDRCSAMNVHKGRYRQFHQFGVEVLV